MLPHTKHVHFVGIGGIGMSALAKWFLHDGAVVSGSDVQASGITRDLEKRGACVTIGHDAANVGADVDLLVYTPAAPLENVERAAARTRGIREVSNFEYLGEVSCSYSTIVVSGTNGKSTTTAMLGLILEAAGYDPTVLVGSFVPSFPDGNLRVGKSRFFVVEGCEYRANMLHLEPEMIVLTNIEEDHLDYYRDLTHIQATFQQFVDKLRGKGMVIMNGDDLCSQALRVERAVRFGSDRTLNVYTCLERTMGIGEQSIKTTMGEFTLRVPGAFNMMNALAATAAAMELGVPFETCARTLSTFPGLWRRFERLGEWHGAELVTDYGHHPTAIRQTLEAAREFFPGRRIVLCYQPHQHDRTRKLFDGFVETLALADSLIVAEIYDVAGRNEAHDISSRDLVKAIIKRSPNLPVEYAANLAEAQKLLERTVREGDVVIVMGAGDIDEIVRSPSFLSLACPAYRQAGGREGLGVVIMTVADHLSYAFGSRLLDHEPLSKHTNFRIGGPARWFVDVRSVNELQSVIKAAREAHIPFFILGGGSNVLVSDKGFDGLVIQTAMRAHEIHGTTVKAQAGVLSAALARATVAAGLEGLTWSISLPGTIGGAVRGNAGCFGGETADRLVSVEVLRGDQVVELTKAELTFGYRESAFKHNDDIILTATFGLAPGNVESLKAELDENLMKRKTSQPLNAGSAGCLFKNLETTEEELQRLGSKLDIPVQMRSARRLGAGWLIDQLDLKGTQIGGARVSDVHGNFVLNTGSATADDVVQLIALVKTRARNEFGIDLKEEIVYVGF